MDIANEFDKDKLARINELAKIAKERELTEEEFNERAELRKEFLENFRAGFRQQLSGIKVVHPEETTVEVVEEEGKELLEEVDVYKDDEGEVIEIETIREIDDDEKEGSCEVIEEKEVKEEK